MVTLRLTDSEQSAILTALHNARVDCLRVANGDDTTPHVATLFRQSAETYARIADKVEDAAEVAQ